MRVLWYHSKDCWPSQLLGVSSLNCSVCSSSWLIGNACKHDRHWYLPVSWPGGSSLLHDRLGSGHNPEQGPLHRATQRTCSSGWGCRTPKSLKALLRTHDFLVKVTPFLRIGLKSKRIHKAWTPTSKPCAMGLWQQWVYWILYYRTHIYSTCLTNFCAFFCISFLFQWCFYSHTPYTPLSSTRVQHSCSRPAHFFTDVWLWFILSHTWGHLYFDLSNAHINTRWTSKIANSATIVYVLMQYGNIYLLFTNNSVQLPSKCESVLC